MKPTKSILILLSLFLMFSCDDDTQTNEDTDDMMSLDWILLMKGGDYSSSSQHFYVENCDGYVECSYYEYYSPNTDTYYTLCDNSEDEVYNCRCDEYSIENDDECGECILTTPYNYRVNSCDGYELCELEIDWLGMETVSSTYDCCYENEIRIYQYDEDENIIDEYDENGNWIGETEIRYYYNEFLFNEYILYWNDDLLVCSDNNCDEESWNFSNYNYDIVIPSHFPRNVTNDCDNQCEYESYFHPNCDTPLDTTMMVGSKSVSFEKMGWFERYNYDNSFGYIHYYPLDNYLIFEGDDDLDISNWKVVDYQRKE